MPAFNNFFGNQELCISQNHLSQTFLATSSNESIFRSIRSPSFPGLRLQPLQRLVRLFIWLKNLIMPFIMPMDIKTNSSLFYSWPNWEFKNVSGLSIMLSANFLLKHFFWLLYYNVTMIFSNQDSNSFS